MNGRSLRLAGGAITALLAVALLAIIILSVSPLLASRNPARPTFFGRYAPMVVLGGSMEPTYHIGSILFIERVDTAAIGRGDVITFETPARPGQPPSLTTHRVMSIDAESERRAFRTRGDANNVEDTWLVPADTVVGRGSLSIPYLGYISSFVRSKLGFFALVIIPAALIVVLELGSITTALRQRKSGAPVRSAQELSADESA